MVCGGGGATAFDGQDLTVVLLNPSSTHTHTHTHTQRHRERAGVGPVVVVYTGLSVFLGLCRTPPSHTHTHTHTQTHIQTHPLPGREGITGEGQGGQ